VKVDDLTARCLTNDYLDACHDRPPKLAPMDSKKHPLLAFQVTDTAVRQWIVKAVEQKEELKVYGRVLTSQNAGLHTVVQQLVHMLNDVQVNRVSEEVKEDLVAAGGQLSELQKMQSDIKKQEEALSLRESDIKKREEALSLRDSELKTYHNALKEEMKCIEHDKKIIADGLDSSNLEEVLMVKAFRTDVIKGQEWAKRKEANLDATVKQKVKLARDEAKKDIALAYAEASRGVKEKLQKVKDTAFAEGVHGTMRLMAPTGPGYKYQTQRVMNPATQSGSFMPQVLAEEVARIVHQYQL
jgi:hypothetical protein